MERKDFLKKSVMGIGALSIIPSINACKSETKKENSNETSKAAVTELQNPKIVKANEGNKLNVLGDNQNIKLSGKDTNGQYTLIEQNNEPGVGIPPHVHDNEDEVFQVLSGQVEMLVGDKTTILQAGDLIFCPKGVPHSWKVVGEEKSRAMLSIFPAGLEDMFKELAELPAGPPDMEKVSAICGKYNLKFV
ncbi:cupin domain-containing protein [Lacinutrix sp. C3R15]|uniref:cupin domain-containing protein n=1 Tax=Flavobacteriaceae TaxID=49546 RepID=UPI001C08D755|nr:MULTISPECIES: cupin domain-containing protein [Flavobacteriaceae]MBU2940210.1 cupin domain-containing protein [Lacinutrix sp. C3R15]MDO6623527.1 cupin domain-containing protein [Oceanihabitans sp. 1_MG-2023]